MGDQRLGFQYGRQQRRDAGALFQDLIHGSCTATDGQIYSLFTRAICSGYASPAGLLLYVPKSLDLRDLHLNTRIRDLSRQAASAGTAIPVVKESEFRSSFLLLDIPSDARFRVNLRVYGGTLAFSPESRVIHPGGPLGTVGVDIYSSRNLLTPLVSTTVRLTEPQAIAGSPYLTHPAFASIGDLRAAFPQLAAVPKYTIRVRMGQPLSFPPVQLSVWAFVTITNNETQEVTTVSP